MFEKPKSVKFELELLKPKEIEYFCKTTEVDELVMKALNLPFDKAVSDEMDKYVRFYMVVDKNRRYDVISGSNFEPYLEKHLMPKEMIKTAKAEACINHFVKFLVKEHEKAAAKNALKQPMQQHSKKIVN